MNSLYYHRYLTEHLVTVFEKPPRESDLNHEPSSLLIQRVKNHTGDHMQSSRIRKSRHTGLAAELKKRPRQKGRAGVRSLREERRQEITLMSEVS
jgi:hypothetical protein